MAYHGNLISYSFLRQYQSIVVEGWIFQETMLSIALSETSSEMTINRAAETKAGNHRMAANKSRNNGPNYRLITVADN